MTDNEVLHEVGGRLRSYRLQQNLGVVEVAARAGVNANTVANVEAGKNARLVTIMRLLRVYGRIETMNAFLPTPRLSPLQLARDKGGTRLRASKRRDG